MTQRDVVLPNTLGLHARAAAKLVQAASKFKSSVYIEKNNQKVNGKSILGILLLAAGQGSDLRVICDGPDEDAALEALVGLVENGFGEMSETSEPAS